MDEKEFLKQQQAAAERMRRMHERSRFNDQPHTMPPMPDFVRIGNDRRANSNAQSEAQGAHIPPAASAAAPERRDGERAESSMPSFPQHNTSGLPLLDRIKDPDTALVLGLMLLLFSENADRRLLMALLYILM